MLVSVSLFPKWLSHSPCNAHCSACNLSARLVCYPVSKSNQLRKSVTMHKSDDADQGLSINLPLLRRPIDFVRKIIWKFLVAHRRVWKFKPRNFKALMEKLWSMCVVGALNILIMLISYYFTELCVGCRGSDITHIAHICGGVHNILKPFEFARGFWGIIWDFLSWDISGFLWIVETKPYF